MSANPEQMLRRLKSHFRHRVAGYMDGDPAGHSAVLLPLVEKDGELGILFEIRAHHLKRQPGETCFPGGRVEEGEEEQYTAVRETSEELGLKMEDIEVYGPLDKVVTWSVIHPFVGKIKDLAKVQPNPDEVAEVFVVPLSYLAEYEPRYYEVQTRSIPPEDYPFHLLPHRSRRRWPERVLPQYFYQYQDKLIWGLTARILHHFLRETGIRP